MAKKKIDPKVQRMMESFNRKPTAAEEADFYRRNAGGPMVMRPHGHDVAHAGPGCVWLHRAPRRTYDPVLVLPAQIQPQAALPATNGRGLAHQFRNPECPRSRLAPEGSEGSLLVIVLGRRRQQSSSSAATSPHVLREAPGRHRLLGLLGLSAQQTWHGKASDGWQRNEASALVFLRRSTQFPPLPRMSRKFCTFTLASGISASRACLARARSAQGRLWQDLRRLAKQPLLAGAGMPPSLATRKYRGVGTGERRTGTRVACQLATQERAIFAG